MRGRLEQKLDEVGMFIPTEEKALRDEFEKLAIKIREHNRNNPRATIPIGNIRRKTYSAFDPNQYDVVSYDLVDEEGDVWDSRTEYIKEKLKEVSYTVKGRDRGDGFDILDQHGDLYMTDFSTREEAEKAVPTLLEEAEKELETEAQFLNKRYHEIANTNCFQYHGYVNRALAHRLGLGVLLTREDEEYLFFRGGGMDLTSKLIAYQAIEFGFVEERAADRLSSPIDRDYVISTMGGSIIYEEVMKTLGITINTQQETA
ncbi:hypothetical protein IMZ31_19555 (plasmid) [Pontibacillus sp. ALD_SL1]|uniref:hypothetical protein n=1 Tax=Pontibacillus sp. ALD_SL1 TaxID=2777185 RepID=UPI001A96AD3D|nr:hypothetical protein [Pontibacillus sp. ALD_SL1]QST02748.1 hypothetical protein IMZ31_19555 [Pontibacillus sp. ALD_SL1]